MATYMAAVRHRQPEFALPNIPEVLHPDFRDNRTKRLAFVARKTGEIQDFYDFLIFQ